MSGAVLGAEMAYHNGMTGVFGLTDAGTEPALLRHAKRAIRSRAEIDSRPDNKFGGHPIIGYMSGALAGIQALRQSHDRGRDGHLDRLKDR